jgi:ABC-2 type transport system ATP-binding protein
VIRALDEVGAVVDDVAVHSPSLDDVFFALTGAPAEPASEPTLEPELEVAR